MIPRRLCLLLVGLGVLLTATVVPGPFTIDEPNYLVSVVALRHGRLTVPGTEGLPPSRELAYFDPTASSRSIVTTPVATTAPPLYAPIALPFSYLGWRGLVALNTIAFLAVAAMVFLYARECGNEAQAGWLAVGAFVLGGYSIEYAQGVWPQMLSAALCTGAVYLTSRIRSGASLTVAFAAGALAGLAAGVRYQNVVFAACVGLGLLAWGPHPLSAAWRFALGASLPLAAAGAMNFARLGSWNPVSKGPGYLSVGAAGGAAGGSLWADTARSFWARVVDFSAARRLAGELYLQRDPVTGAYMVGSAMKKAWLQSAPWILLALVFLCLAWVTHAGLDARARRETRALSLVVFGVLFMFAVALTTRHDGLGFNQRYFLELVPLAAVAFAWSMAGVRLKRDSLLGGFLLGGLAVFGALYWASLAFRQYSQRILPLVFAVLLTAAWVSPRWRHRAPVLALLVGACLGWAFFVHLGEDVPASQNLRALKLARFRALDQAIPARSAVFAYWGQRDAGALLHLDRDVVILDPSVDDGESARELAAALLAAGRRVFVVANGLPRDVFEAIRGPGQARAVEVPPLLLLEIEAPSP